MSYQKIEVLSDILEAKDTFVPGYDKEINYPTGYWLLTKWSKSAPIKFHFWTKIAMFCSKTLFIRNKMERNGTERNDEMRRDETKRHDTKFCKMATKKMISRKRQLWKFLSARHKLHVAWHSWCFAINLVILSLQNPTPKTCRASHSSTCWFSLDLHTTRDPTKGVCPMRWFKSAT